MPRDSVDGFKLTRNRHGVIVVYCWKNCRRLRNVILPVLEEFRFIQLLVRLYLLAKSKGRLFSFGIKRGEFALTTADLSKDRHDFEGRLFAAALLSFWSATRPLRRLVRCLVLRDDATGFPDERVFSLFSLGSRQRLQFLQRFG